MLTFHAALLAIQFVQLAVFSRILAPADFGIIAMASTITLFVRQFLDMGLSSATVQMAQLDDNTVSGLFLINQCVGVTLMLICWIIAPMAAATYRAPELRLVIPVLALSFPLTSLQAQHRALLVRQLKFARVNSAQLAGNVVGFVLGVFLAIQFNLGYWSLVASMLSGAAISTLVVWRFSQWRPKVVRSWIGARTAVQFGLNVMFSNLLSWVWRQSDNALIGWRWGASELGYYSRAYSIILIPLLVVGGPFASALIPILSRLQSDREAWTRMFLRATRLVALASALIGLLTTIDAGLIVRLLLGSSWSHSAEILEILSIGLLPAAAWELSRIAFLSLGHSGAMFKYALIAGPAYLFAFWLGLNLGGYGVAIGFAAVSWAISIPALLTVSIAAKIEKCALVAAVLPVVCAYFTALIAAKFTLVPTVTIGTFSEIALSSAIGVSVFFAVLVGLSAFNKGWRDEIEFARTGLAGLVAKSGC
jgi:PST family polysaccharide transporter